jgi:DNA processing protein
MLPPPSDPRDLRLLLNGLTGIGPVSARRLQEAFGGDLRRALLAGPKELAVIKGLTAPMVASLLRRDFDHVAELRRAETLGYRILHADDAAWPQALGQLWDPPLVLYQDGSALPDARAVAIIGSRHCTPYGAGLARGLARDLAKLGWWIVSGLARGIDFAAHEGALEAEGRTAAVLGHGLDLTYPPEALKLRRRMTERGCVLSEFPLGRPADRQSFPQRNRIVAGLVRAVVVVETDVDGGSMITARFAGEQGKTLCALPGRVDSPTSRGCHALIRDGATLVSSVDDILAELGEERGQLALPLTQADPADARWLKHFGGGTAHDSESLAAVVRCTQAEAAVALTMLEIQGHLLRRTDGRHERG